MLSVPSSTAHFQRLEYSNNELTATERWNIKNLNLQLLRRPNTAFNVFGLFHRDDFKGMQEALKQLKAFTGPPANNNQNYSIARLSNMGSVEIRLRDRGSMREAMTKAQD
jgi:hypothetical protein